MHSRYYYVCILCQRVAQGGTTLRKSTFRTTISLNFEQNEQMKHLAEIHGCSQADVMRMTLDQFWQNYLNQDDDLQFILQMKGVFGKWLDHRGLTRNLGTANQNVSRFFSDNTPFNFMMDRGGDERA